MTSASYASGWSFARLKQSHRSWSRKWEVLHRSDAWTIVQDPVVNMGGLLGRPSSQTRPLEQCLCVPLWIQSCFPPLNTVEFYYKVSSLKSLGVPAISF